MTNDTPIETTVSKTYHTTPSQTGSFPAKLGCFCKSDDQRCYFKHVLKCEVKWGKKNKYIKNNVVLISKSTQLW